MTAVGIYVRISSDTTGQGLGIQRQEEDCRALAAARGWDVAEVYADNDVSAYSGRPRPAYERLLTDIAAGHVRAVVAWHADRLHRSPRELERFITLAERTGLQVETVQAGTVDLSTASGRAVARTLGAWARYESEHKSDRIRRKLAQNAAAGLPHGGQRPYGWEMDRMRTRESESQVIRECYRRLLAEEPIRSVIRDLNARGVYTSTGRPWTHVTFRKMIVQGRHAGVLTHLGQEVGTAAWPAIVPPETWRALCRLLTDPARVTSPGRGGRVHLLSGIARCGVCGGPLRVGQSKGTTAYRCQQNNCTSRRRDYLEEFVAEVLISRLSRPDAAGLLAPDDDGDREQAAREAEAVRERLDDAAAAFASGLLTMRQLETISARLRPELAALETAAAPAPDRSAVLGALIGAPDVRTAWESLGPDARRAVVRLLLRITVQRARRGNTFSTDGIDLEWC